MEEVRLRQEEALAMSEKVKAAGETVDAVLIDAARLRQRTCEMIQPSKGDSSLLSQFSSLNYILYSFFSQFYFFFSQFYSFFSILSSLNSLLSSLFFLLSILFSQFSSLFLPATSVKIEKFSGLNRFLNVEISQLPFLHRITVRRHTEISFLCEKFNTG